MTLNQHQNSPTDTHLKNATSLHRTTNTLSSPKIIRYNNLWCVSTRAHHRATHMCGSYGREETSTLEMKATSSSEKSVTNYSTSLPISPQLTKPDCLRHVLPSVDVLVAHKVAMSIYRWWLLVLFVHDGSALALKLNPQVSISSHVQPSNYTYY
jgi:hypothetical protein